MKEGDKVLFRADAVEVLNNMSQKKWPWSRRIKSRLGEVHLLGKIVTISEVAEFNGIKLYRFKHDRGSSFLWPAECFGACDIPGFKSRVVVKAI